MILSIGKNENTYAQNYLYIISIVGNIKFMYERKK